MANFDQVTMGLAELLDAKKAEKIVLLDVSRQTILAETFVVCSGRSPAQLRMLADEAEQYMAKNGIFKKRMEAIGRAGGLSWISAICWCISSIERSASSTTSSGSGKTRTISWNTRACRNFVRLAKILKIIVKL